MARAHFSDDSDEDLPELNELINKHVKSLPILQAPVLDLSSSGRSRTNLLSPKKYAPRSTQILEDAHEEADNETRIPKKKELVAVSNTQLDQIKPLQASRTRRKKQPDLQASSSFTLTTRTRATPHRSAKAVVNYSPVKRDALDFKEDESEVEESIWCGSEDEPDLSSVRDILSRSPKKSKPRQYTPDFDLSDSDDDIFGFKERPTKPLRTYQSPAKEGQKQFQRQSDLPRLAESSDKENDGPALLKFSPPRLTRPVLGSAVERPATPPPPASPSKSKLVSPSKKKARLPTPPHRPSIDTFWNVHAVNDWHDQYSPKKLLMSPKKKAAMREREPDSPSASPRKSQSPTKRTRAENEAKKDFESQKRLLCEEFFAELDREVTDGQVQELAALTGGVKFIWSKTLNSTAGRANWRRESTKQRNLDGTTTVTYKHHASIELAEKVINDEERLINVVAHEFCHLANFMVSGIKDQPHGRQFKIWGAKATKAFAHRGVEITTKHSYQIDYKYIWTCTNEDCGQEFKRHSKSIDLSRHTCGNCRSKLVQTKPVPRKQAGATGYAAFVKENFASLKKELGAGSSHKEVMGALGRRYREQKGTAVPAGGKTAAAADIDDMAKALEVINLSD